MMDYINIKGFKSIKETFIEFRPINVLIGANGSGKSNLLSFFGFLDAVYNQKLKEYNAYHKGADYVMYNGSEHVEEIAFEISVEKYNKYKAVIEPDSSGEFFFQKEEILDSEDKQFFHSNSYAKESEIKLLTTNETIRPLETFFSQLRMHHFHDTGDKSPFRKMSHAKNDIHFLYEKGDNISAILYNIQQTNPKAYYRIVKTIQSIAPFFSDFFLKPSSDNFLRLQWQDKYSSTTYGPEDLSDGTLRFIALATLFLQPKPPKTIIIDEPELGLHPAAISKLSGMINVAVAKGVQVIVATQSPDFVNNFEPEDVITVDNQGYSVFRRLNKKDLNQWLADYSVGELWQRNIINGGQPRC